MASHGSYELVGLNPRLEPHSKLPTLKLSTHCLASQRMEEAAAAAAATAVDAVAVVAAGGAVVAAAAWPSARGIPVVVCQPGGHPEEGGAEAPGEEVAGEEKGCAYVLRGHPAAVAGVGRGGGASRGGGAAAENIPGGCILMPELPRTFSCCCGCGSCCGCVYRCCCSCCCCVNACKDWCCRYCCCCHHWRCNCCWSKKCCCMKSSCCCWSCCA